jgi:AcrR family transcriptional regulator
MPPQNRAQTTAATRTRIIEAARTLLATRPPSAFTLAEVGAAAGVTRLTVYHQVGSRVGLLDAVLTDSVARAGLDELVTRTDALPPDRALAGAVERTCRFWAAERAVLRPLFALAAAEDELRAHLAQREGWRRAQFARLLERGGADPTAPELDGIVAVTSFPAYDALGDLADDPATAATIVWRMVMALT